jgi:hypothetical protein
MDRFRGEEEKEVLYCCDYCGREIYVGNEYYQIPYDHCNDYVHILCFEDYAYEKLQPKRKDGYDESDI